MPKPAKVDYTPIIAEYQTGQYSVAFLAKKYKIKRATLAKYISVNQIRISNNLKEGVMAIDRGLESLKVTKEYAKSNDLTPLERERAVNALNKGLEYLEAKHGELAQYVVNLVAKGFKKGNEMLDATETPEEYLATMRGIKTGADTLGLFPKTPLVAIQQNISKEINQSLKADNLQIEVNFISSDDKKQDADIIEAEIKD